MANWQKTTMACISYAIHLIICEMQRWKDDTVRIGIVDVIDIANIVVVVT